MDSAGLLPFLIKCGDIAFNHLRESLLSEDQICTYLHYMNSPGITFGQVRRRIIQEDGHSDEIFLAIESLSRINDLCNVVENLGEDQITPEHALYASFFIFRAGIVIGGLLSAEGKQKLYSEMKEKLLPLAEHGVKFSENKGKHVDDFTHHLVSLFESFHCSHGRYPSNKEVQSLLEQEAEQGFIHTANDEVIEWDGGSTLINSLQNRLTRVRKLLRTKITIIGKP